LLVSATKFQFHFQRSYELEDPGSNVQLRIYTHVREDALQLYGFKTARERELFMRLISVSGIGPKLGITLLSGMSADEMIAVHSHEQPGKAYVDSRGGEENCRTFGDGAARQGRITLIRRTRRRS
jgi:hypothetical protein